MVEQHSIVYIYYKFSIHSSVDEHLGGFHVVPIVNMAAIKIGVHLSFPILVSSRYMLVGGLLGHISILTLRTPWRQKDMTLKDELPRSVGGFIPSFCFFFFKGISIETVTIYIPTNSARGFLFSTPSQNLLFVDFWRWPFWPVWGDTSL